MKKRLIFATAVCLLILALLFLAVELEIRASSGDPEEVSGSKAVKCNDISRMIAEGDTDGAQRALAEFSDSLVDEDSPRPYRPWLIAAFSVSAVFCAAVFLYVLLTLIIPFERMSEFAGRVAAGNLELPLKLTRGSYFGKFTWAFDSMRNEILRARAGEREAAENGKTVIAALSHDIKTPIASLRLYTEALEAGMDTTAEKRQKYIDVIKKKCDEVARLTDDLFLHAISDMGRLSVETETLELNGFLTESISELSAGQGDITLICPEERIFISADRKRLLQITENLINNARKYAGTRMEIGVSVADGMAAISYRDFGPGIPDADLPFALGKFYRGKNVGDVPGSGLGLYIVSQLAGKMGGGVNLRNNSGLEVIVSIPLSTS